MVTCAGGNFVAGSSVFIYGPMIAFVNVSSPASFSAASEVDVDTTGLDTIPNFLPFVAAFEAVTAGPWITLNMGGLSANYIGPSEGLKQACYQAPSASGIGLEAWVAIEGVPGGSLRKAKFASNQTGVAVILAWSGAYETTGNISDGALRAATTAQVTGDAPAAPSIFAFQNELVITVGCDDGFVRVRRPDGIYAAGRRRAR